ncbi:hypothetical protein [Chryseobacterium oryctis]|uniref:MBG domain-containing protein n=1 Tax=Chryseobacterium oryctis TaxID=2952618 RepID=A0ABT3HM29_9FLAO|nr:hypothetical protein [Chryseobacterium oryctis]MCW3160831.1 hypothetical protein [Chryseobacterium oryctis]
MRNSVLILFIGISGFSYSQVGINTEIPATTLDVVGKPSDPSKLDGIIAPRLSGDELSAKTYTSAQTGALVYVNAAAGSLTGQVANVDAPGYYYFDGTVWVKTSGSDTEPWYNQLTNTGATSNVQNVYMGGSVAIGKTFNHGGPATSGGTMLDVQGAVRGGSSPEGSVGESSVGFGAQVEASGDYSASFGLASVASGKAEFVAGIFNAITTGSTAILQVGNGADGARSNALTILKNGNIGTDLAIAPTERLDIGSGNVRIRGINANTGASGDKYVVADANGVLKTVTKQTALLVGGDLSDALLSTSTITAPSGGNTFTSNVLGTYTLNITQKSLVSFSYDVSYSWSPLSTIDNGAPRMAATYMQFTAKPASSTIALNTAFANQRLPITASTNVGAPGYYFHSTSARLVLEPGSYTVELRGGLYSPSGPATLTFGGTQDNITIVADPIF